MEEDIARLTHEAAGDEVLANAQPARPRSGAKPLITKRVVVLAHGQQLLGGGQHAKQFGRPVVANGGFAQRGLEHHAAGALRVRGRAGTSAIGADGVPQYQGERPRGILAPGGRIGHALIDRVAELVEEGIERARECASGGELATREHVAERRIGANGAAQRPERERPIERAVVEPLQQRERLRAALLAEMRRICVHEITGDPAGGDDALTVHTAEEAHVLSGLRLQRPFPATSRDGRGFEGQQLLEVRFHLRQPVIAPASEGGLAAQVGEGGGPGHLA